MGIDRVVDSVDGGDYAYSPGGGPGLRCFPRGPRRPLRPFLPIRRFMIFFSFLRCSGVSNARIFNMVPTCSFRISILTWPMASILAMTAL